MQASGKPRHPCDANDCNDTTTPTKRCGRCKRAWYCSVACQRQHRAQHAPFCIPKCHVKTRMTNDPELMVDNDTVSRMRECVQQHHRAYVRHACTFMTVVDGHPIAYGNLHETLETLKRWIPHDLLALITPQIRQCAQDHTGQHAKDVAIAWFTSEPVEFVCDRMLLE